MPAAEMKHGPIALIDDGMPAVFIANPRRQYEKVMSNIAEVRARGGHVIAVATEGDREIAKVAEEVLYIPECPECLSPMLAVVPLQLMAYHAAVLRGHDVDKPRNLAVEERDGGVKRCLHARSAVLPVALTVLLCLASVSRAQSYRWQGFMLHEEGVYRSHAEASMSIWPAATWTGTVRSGPEAPRSM
jgi:hypothetical protein